MEPIAGKVTQTTPNTYGVGQEVPVLVDSAGRLLVVDTPSSTPPTPPATSPYVQTNVSVSSSGDNTLIAGVALQTVRCYSLILMPASPVDITIKDGAGTTLAVFPQVWPSLVIDPMEGNNPPPRFVTAAGNALVINLGAAVAVKGAAWTTQS